MHIEWLGDGGEDWGSFLWSSFISRPVSSLFAILPPLWSFFCMNVALCILTLRPLHSGFLLLTSPSLVLTRWMLLSTSPRPSYFQLVLPPCVRIYLSPQKCELFVMTSLQTWPPRTTLRTLHVMCFSLCTTLWDWFAMDAFALQMLLLLLRQS